MKAKFCRSDAGTRAGAKAHIRYIEHRPGKEGERITRTLFTSEGQIKRKHAYEMIDQAQEGSYFYRLVLSPDPMKEDGKKDLLVRDIAQRTINSLEERLGVPISWVGAMHADHVPHRHVHLFAILPVRLNKEDLVALRLTATALSVEQRTELDAALAYTQQQKAQLEREEEQWERGV